jgi:hypothetical protein
MRNLPRILIASALSTLALSTMTITTAAADPGDSVKTGSPPYKPGREIDDRGFAEDANATQDAPSEGDGAKPVKHRAPPYNNPGRQANGENDDADSAKN